MADFYLKCRTVSEAMKFYLTQGVGGDGGGLAAPGGGGGLVGATTLHIQQQQDQFFNLVASFSLEFRSKLYEEWKSVLSRNRSTTGVILLLGATGGIVFYLVRRNRRRSSRRTPLATPKDSLSAGGHRQRAQLRRSLGGRYGHHHTNNNSFLSWLFQEEVVEDLSRDSYWLRSHYFGPVSTPAAGVGVGPQHYYGQHHPAAGIMALNETLDFGSDSRDETRSEYDVSLNSWGAATTPRKFLKAPLIYDIRRQKQQHARRSTSRTRLLTPVGGSRQHQQQAVSAAGAMSRCNPCPRCVKGTCRIKRHQAYTHQLYTSSNNNANNGHSYYNDAMTSSGSSSALSTSPVINQFDRKNLLKTSTPADPTAISDDSMLHSHNHHQEHRYDGDGSDETEDSTNTDPLIEDLARYAKDGTPHRHNPAAYLPTQGLFRRQDGQQQQRLKQRGAPDGKERGMSMSPSPHPSLHKINQYDALIDGSSSNSADCHPNTPERSYIDGSCLRSRDYSEDCLPLFSGAGAAVNTEDEYEDSGSVTGSMLDLVHDAREIRRLIREVSIDSNASDLSLGSLGGGCSGLMGLYLPPPEEDYSFLPRVEDVTRGLDDLILNCANFDEVHHDDGENLDSKSESGDIYYNKELKNISGKMASSKSSTSGLYQYADDNFNSTSIIKDDIHNPNSGSYNHPHNFSATEPSSNNSPNTSPSTDDSSMKNDDSSIPDLRALQATLKKSNKGLWRLTNITNNTSSSSDNGGGGGSHSRQASVLSDSGGDSLEWDSPINAGTAVLSSSDILFQRHNRYNRYRTPVLSSNVSECSVDDLSSLAGSSCLDQWEWDDTAYYCMTDEDDEKILLTANGGAFLPADEGGAFTTELDLEAELRMGGGCLLEDANNSTTRLPPSGRSSAERGVGGIRRLSLTSTTSSRCSSVVSDDVTLKSAGEAAVVGAANAITSRRRKHSRSRERALLGGYQKSYANEDVMASSTTATTTSEVDLESTGCSSMSSSGISSMNSSLMSSSTSSSSGLLAVSNINLSPVKESNQELLLASPPPLRSSLSPQPPSLRSTSSSSNTPASTSSSRESTPPIDRKGGLMEISLGNIRTTDTVIKVQLPAKPTRDLPAKLTGEDVQKKAPKCKASVALFPDEEST